MRLCTGLLLLFITTLVFLEVFEAARGGRGGGFRGGSRGGSRGSSRGSSGRSRGPKITKFSPIKATTARSPVIVKQTKRGSRSDIFKKAVVGYIVYRYALSSAPVYRRGYPMYRNFVTIPERRAVRITYEEEKLLNDAGKLCLGRLSQNQTLREGIEKNLVELNTTVTYKKTGETKTYYGNSTLLEDIKEQDFEVISRARYNTTIVEGTTCSQVERYIKGTMVTLYETNPNKGSSLSINNKLLVTLIILFGAAYVRCIPLYS